MQTKVGNILTVNTALDTCASNDLCMSKGASKGFKESFRHLEALNPHKHSVGNVFVFFDTALNRYIYYLKTKEDHFEKPTFLALTDCLQNLAKILRIFRVKKLGITRPGCGLDQVDWKVFEALVRDKLGSLAFEVSVYHPASRMCYFGKPFHWTGVAVQTNHFDSIFRQDTQ